MMPRFFKDIPTKQDVLWIAVVIRTSPFHGGHVVYESAPVKGIRWAYIKARLAALYWDLITPYADGELGINWAIKEAKVI